MKFDSIIEALVDRRAKCLEVLNSIMSDNTFIFATTHDEAGNLEVCAVSSEITKKQFSFKALKAMNSAIEKLTLKNSEVVDFNEIGFTGAELVQITKALVESDKGASHKSANIIVDELVCRLHEMATNHEHF